LIAIYQARLKNEIADLPSLTVQYPDYALWVANETDPVMLESQLKYWKRKLAGMPPFLDLPHSRPYPAMRTSWGATLPLKMPIDLQNALKQLGHEDGVTPFLVFLTIFALLLYIYSGSEDFCIGSPITLRKQDETKRMAGVFVNMLAFRCQLTPEMSFRKFLKQIRQTAVEAYDNSDLPFQKLVSAFKPDRKSLRSPIFQVLFGFESSAQGTGSAFQIDTEAGTARYDLSLNIVDADNIFASFEYCTDIFDVADIEEICKGLSVIEKMVLYPDQELSQFITFDPQASFTEAAPVIRRSASGQV
jgi:non-ribosomal peptide synthetase component F